MQWILNQSAEICVGGERYAHRLWSDEGLTPALFEADRFFHRQDGDTFYPIERERYFQQKQRFWSHVRFIGDKLPLLAVRLPMVAAAFPGARVIVMVRNVIDVAASYKKRCGDGDGSWEGGGVSEAVQQWNNTMRAVRQPYRSLSLLPLIYEDFFLDRVGFDALVDFLGTTHFRPLLRGYRDACIRARELETERPRQALTSTELAYIAKAADFGAYQAIARGEQVAQVRSHEERVF